MKTRIKDVRKVKFDGQPKRFEIWVKGNDLNFCAGRFSYTYNAALDGRVKKIKNGLEKKWSGDKYEVEVFGVH